MRSFPCLIYWLGWLTTTAGCFLLMIFMRDRHYANATLLHCLWLLRYDFMWNKLKWATHNYGRNIEPLLNSLESGHLIPFHLLTSAHRKVAPSAVRRPRHISNGFGINKKSMCVCHASCRYRTPLKRSSIRQSIAPLSSHTCFNTLSDSACIKHRPTMCVRM